MTPTVVDGRPSGRWAPRTRHAFALRARPFVLEITPIAVETLWDAVTHELVAQCVGLELATLGHHYVGAH